MFDLGEMMASLNSKDLNLIPVMDALYVYISHMLLISLEEFSDGSRVRYEIKMDMRTSSRSHLGMQFHSNCALSATKTSENLGFSQGTDYIGSSTSVSNI